MSNALLLSMVSAFTPALVTLSGESISAASNSVGLRINAGASSGVAGTIDSRKGAVPTYAQLDGATDWIIPNVHENRKPYHVRFNVEESSMNAGSDLMNQWITLDQDREWWHVFATLTRNGELFISDDGGVTTLASALYDLTIP